MSRKLLLLCALLYQAAVAQQPLSQSPRTSAFTYIYKIPASEALELYKKRLDRSGEKYLHTRMDSFPTEGVPPLLPEGNFLLVYAKENQLYYELKSVGDLQLKVVNNKRDLVVVLHRKNGEVINDARVSLGRKPLRFDAQTNSYRLNKDKRGGALQVVLANTAYYFMMEGSSAKNIHFRKIRNRVAQTFPLKYVTRLVRKWQGRDYHYWNYFDRPTPYEQKFRSFLTFSKPLYKPGDTVKLKAFVLHKNGKPVNSPLLLRLTNKQFDVDTILTLLKPYRPGGYTYQFALNDSLDLDLDEGYLLTLEEERSRRYDVNAYEGDLDEDEYASRRKVVARGTFEYEEYELESITFSARANKTELYRGEPLALFLKATDENDLPVMDGRLQLTLLTTNNNREQFHAPAVFLPDTLWTHSLALEALGETKVTVPDSIFPQASFHYEVECVLLNSNNERQTHTLYGKFQDQPERLAFTLQKDSLGIDLQVKEVSKPAKANIYSFTTETDSLLVGEMNLPAVIRLNPYVQFYRVASGSIFADYKLSETKNKVSALASRTPDSLFVRLYNPLRLPVWYTVFAGNKVLYRGYADSLALNTKTRTRRNYFLSLQYIWGNKVNSEEYTIGLQDKLLNVSVSTPRVVFPGQTAAIEIGVTDVAGKPVADADLTAYSFTRKFSRAAPPIIPYLGKIYPSRKAGASFSSDGLDKWSKTGKLNWGRWSRDMGLDSMEYFKFLHPDTLYWNKETTKDSVTQIAPFVTIGGDLQPIHLLYIDEKPVFFSQSQHLQRYSFRLQPGRHSLRMRIPDRVITLKDIDVPKGVKTILSINGDTANKLVSIQKAPDTLTRQERILLTRYTILVEHHFGEYFPYVEQDNNLYLLSQTPYRNYSNMYLVGPLSPRGADLVVHDQFRQSFEVEDGYSYLIYNGLIKQKEAPTSRYIGKWLYKSAPPPDFSDLVLTGDEVDSLWADYLDKRSANEDLFVNRWVEKKGNGTLRIDIPGVEEGKEVFVKNIFLFRHEDTDFIKVYKGTTRDLGYLAPGQYRVYVLLKGDRYILLDSVRIQKDGVNFYRLTTAYIKNRDSISRKLAQIVQRRELSNRSTTEGLDQIKENFNTQFLDISSFRNEVSGQVRDHKGQPLASVTISVKGTHVATLSDARGFYQLRVPEKGTLVFSAVGFENIEQPINGSLIDVLLAEAQYNLQEVVVVGYGVQKKKSISASVSSVSQTLSGRVAGLVIRGSSAVQGSAAPLIVVDGVPFEGSLEELDPALLASITVLKQEVATALYGSKAANGALLITTKKTGAPVGVGEDGQPLPQNSIRRHFRDDAYWQPTLRTGKDGKVRFTTTFPDDITNWRTFATAVASGKRTGFAEGSIRSFKPVSANLLLPQFAVEGDQVNLMGKTLNFGTDSLQLKRSIAVNQHIEKEGVISVRNAYIDTVAVHIIPGDSMHFRMDIQKEDGYFDGEERSIPVFKQGVKETKGVFAALEGDTSFTVQLDPALGPITLHAEASLLPVLLDETEKIYHYEYLCNEQLASKLKALLVQKKIYDYLKKDFTGESSIRELISRLNNAKTGQLWGWWPNNEAAPWISLHVVEALLMAEKEGYLINLGKQAVVDYLVYRLEDYHYRDQILILNMLQQLGAKVDYKKYVDTLQKAMDKKYNKPPLYERLRLIELQQKLGLHYSLDSLLPQAKHTLFGNLYWGEDGYRFFDNSTQNTILMYRILKAQGGQEFQLRKIRNYFLEKRKDGQWRNTYESSLILETILPDLISGSEPPRPARLRLQDGEVIENFPYTREGSTGSLVSLHKEGDMPLYVTAYQQLWNARPKAVAGAFTVTSGFKGLVDSVTRLKAGEPLDLEVQVDVKGDADFVMIEVPIPAGCSYKEKPQPYTYNEVHREYFKNKVSIFCSNLKQGTYTFRVPLLPRYTGLYHVNPAKAEMMYFPVFYGREGLKRVSIE